MADAARRVLIIEDAEEIRSSVADILEGEGYEVSCAPNGLDALAQLRAATTLPGLILLDLMMPDMGGDEFRAAQRDDARLANIPVLIMSAGGDLQAKARELGALGSLRKPFRDIDTILDAVARAFR